MNQGWARWQQEPDEARGTYLVHHAPIWYTFLFSGTHPSVWYPIPLSGTYPSYLVPHPNPVPHPLSGTPSNIGEHLYLRITKVDFFNP